MRPNFPVALLLTGLTLAPAFGQTDPPAPSDWAIDGQTRQALVIPPTAKTEAAPVLFVFHGHGGNMRAMAKNDFLTLWPEAVVVCPQGLPTATPRDPKGEKPGWDSKSADNNRDLKFVDAILATVRDKYKIDGKRIYATGHSNGGGFAYLLAAARGDVFAAVAPSAAGAVGRSANAGAKPIPVMHVAGQKDETVPFANQTQTIEAVRKFNGCDPDGVPWATAGGLVGTLYPSKGGTPVVVVVHPGTHKYPAEAPGLVVKFFKESAKK